MASITSSRLAPSRMARGMYWRSPRGEKLTTLVTMEIRKRVFGSRCRPDSRKNDSRCPIASGRSCDSHCRPLSSFFSSPSLTLPPPGMGSACSIDAPRRGSISRPNGGGSVEGRNLNSEIILS